MKLLRPKTTFHAPISVALQTVGALSALIFALNFSLEILILFGRVRNHQVLLLALLSTLAIWAVCEAVMLRRKGTEAKLERLLILLLGQLLIEFGRALLVLWWPQTSALNLFENNSHLSGLVVLLPLYGVIFLAISRSLIQIHTFELDEAYRTITRLEQSALKLTDAIPVGTYVMEASPLGSPRFTFVSQRFLEMLNVSREEVVSDAALAFRTVHTEDFDDFVATQAHSFNNHCIFKWEGRFVIKGETCWMSIEAVPRALTNGNIAFEGVTINITAYKETLAELKRTYEKLTQIAIYESRRKERDQLLQDMHDGFGSQLAGVRMMAEQGRLSPEELPVYLQEISADLHLVVDTLSQQDITLEEAIYDMRYRVERRFAESNIQFKWSVGLSELKTLSPRNVLHILRITQEAMHNALRHAKASTIELTAIYDTGDQQLQIGIRDDGVGISNQPRNGRGIANMQHRAREIGAQLQINALHPGTSVQIRLDLSSV